MTDWDATRYHRVSEPQFDWGQRVIARLKPAAGERILDLGCGTGRLTQEISAPAAGGPARVVGLDRSGSMLAVARAAIPHAESASAGPPGPGRRRRAAVPLGVRRGVQRGDAALDSRSSGGVPQRGRRARCRRPVRGAVRRQGQPAAHARAHRAVAGVAGIPRALRRLARSVEFRRRRRRPRHGFAPPACATSRPGSRRRRSISRRRRSTPTSSRASASATISIACRCSSAVASRRI